MDTTTHSNDQDWDVFRYVADEMTGEEELRFEDRLGQDQRLREQVAKMTMTLANVEQAFDRSCKTRQLKTVAADIRVRRFFVTAAAMVAIAALGISLSWPSPSVEPTPSAESIAIAWAQECEMNEFELSSQDEGEDAALEFSSTDDDWVAGVIAAIHVGK